MKSFNETDITKEMYEDFLLMVKISKPSFTGWPKNALIFFSQGHPPPKVSESHKVSGRDRLKNFFRKGRKTIWGGGWKTYWFCHTCNLIRTYTFLDNTLSFQQIVMKSQNCLKNLKKTQCKISITYFYTAHKEILVLLLGMQFYW